MRFCFRAFSFFGVGLSYGFREQWMFGGFVTVAGVVELIASLTHKRRWINGCLQATCTGKTVEIEFTNESLNSSSRNGTSSLRISAFDSIVPATNGFFLIPDSGVSIYIPQNSIDPPDAYQALIQFLVAEIELPKNGA